MTEKRSIFEEVGLQADEVRKAAAKGRAPGPGRGAIRAWLTVLFVLVAAMIVLGGLTRLTDSGLSITEWRPLTGALPPWGEAAWLSEFEKYQAIPEYRLQNKGMALAEFKRIYWWEWSHRQLGRIVGLVWAAGFVWFALLQKGPAGWSPRLLGIGVLGGSQGALGWWMVSSGLSGTVLDVASYRLAIHLGLAFIILGLIAWYVLLLGRGQVEIVQARRQRERRLFKIAGWLVAVAFFQILLGALVAGIDAGRNYTDWPLMDGAFLPPGSFALQPVARNFFESAALVQFDHRMVGYGLLAFALLCWWISRKSALNAVRKYFGWMALVLVAQAGLGIATVLNAAPLTLAIIHQIGAIVMFVVILRARFEAGYPAAQSIRA